MKILSLGMGVQSTAIEVDKAIRDSTKKGMSNPAYLHDACKPLEEIKFDPEHNSDLWKGECSGSCHI